MMSDDDKATTSVLARVPLPYNSKRKNLIVNLKTELLNNFNTCRDSSILFSLEINHTNAQTPSSDRERTFIRTRRGHSHIHSVWLMWDRSWGMISKLWDTVVRPFVCPSIPENILG